LNIHTSMSTKTPEILIDLNDRTGTHSLLATVQTVSVESGEISENTILRSSTALM
jgi:hypothetical protein